MTGKIKSIEQFFAEMQAKYASQYPEHHQKVTGEMTRSLEVVMALPSTETRERLLMEAEQTYRECLHILLNGDKAQEYLQDLSDALQELSGTTKNLIANLRTLEKTLTETEQRARTSQKHQELLINFDTDKVLVS